MFLLNQNEMEKVNLRESDYAKFSGVQMAKSQLCFEKKIVDYHPSIGV